MAKDKFSDFHYKLTCVLYISMKYCVFLRYTVKHCVLQRVAAKKHE